MKKEYQKPDVIEVELVSQEDIATGSGIVDGTTGVESSIFPMP